MELLFEFLTGELRLDPKPVAETLWRDYQRGGRHDKPVFLKDFLPVEDPVVPLRKTKGPLCPSARPGVWCKSQSVEKVVNNFLPYFLYPAGNIC